jgi:hypothetical protein
MAKDYAQLESDMVAFFNNNSKLPCNLPEWISNLGITPNDTITKCTNMGSQSPDNKTDILIEFSQSPPIKISVKLDNADYFGNWYTHQRITSEFSIGCLSKLFSETTNWANCWATKPQASLFVGVSICFGKRSGETALDFDKVFSVDDIRTIVQGFNPDSIKSANSLYVASQAPTTYTELFDNLKPIDNDTLLEIASNFKIVMRPINPMTEGTNRAKQIYTKFVPYKKLVNVIEINSLVELMKLGRFSPLNIESGDHKINHNRVIKELLTNFNIKIPVKPNNLV